MPLPLLRDDPLSMTGIVPPDPTDAATWLDELQRRLPRHADVLRRVREGAVLDARIVQFSVGCSIARGVADELSDLDCELSLEADAWPSGVELVEPLVRSCGEVVEVLNHNWAGAGSSEHRRIAVVYANGVQLDLMVWPVTAWSGMHPPDTVVLHARRPVFTLPWDPARATVGVDRLIEWRFLGWWALVDADKYLRRRSLWEARQRLEEVRTRIWQLSAAAQGIPFAEWGITSLLDDPEARLPDGAETTAAGLDASGMRAAVTQCAHLLEAQWRLITQAHDSRAGIVPPVPAWALERLGLTPDPGEADKRRLLGAE